MKSTRALKCDDCGEALQVCKCKDESPKWDELQDKLYMEENENEKYINTLLENTNGKHFIFAGSNLRKALKAQSIISKTEAFRDIIEIIKKKGDVYKGSDYMISVLENHLNS